MFWVHHPFPHLFHALSLDLTSVSHFQCSYQLVCTVPELNPAMDTYRIGTLLEMIRELAYSLADVGLNTKILIQPSMGEGIFKSLPLALSGVMNIMQGMDWKEGIVGERVNFGAVSGSPDFVFLRKPSVPAFILKFVLVS